MPDHEHFPSGGDENSAEVNARNSRRRDLELGSKVLAGSGFEGRHKDIVDSTFLKARARGEKFPGRNNERRDYSYLDRIEKLINEHGEQTERELWRMSANKLLIPPENIPQKYWNSVEQNFRDNGYAHKLEDKEKQEIAKNIRDNQLDSLMLWADYFSDPDSPYPTWFKIYAWDGMSKMGFFDKDTQQFSTRYRGTVAPYPRLNPAALAKVYSAVAGFYGSKQPQTDNPVESKLQSLVKSGNFNKLYSEALLDQKTILKTPEKTEDVHGEWLEYFPGDEAKVANAAQGTPWCTVDARIARNYLEYGRYSDESDNDDDDDDDESPKENKAKFVLFHLYDPETNALSESACASIRINPEGNVAEISGLVSEGRQAVEDSLVPIVEEKVRSLPGGEKYLKAFADKKRLIELDRKMKNNADLTKDDLEFLYEVKSPITNLDTYGGNDPRLKMLKMRYGVEYALNAGVELNQLVSRLRPGIIAGNIDSLIRHGADIDKLTERFSPKDQAKYLNVLISRGADIDAKELIAKLTPGQIVDNLAALSDNGAEIGIDIDVDDLVSRVHSGRILENLDTLLTHKANADQLALRLEPEDFFDHLSAFIPYNISQETVEAKREELLKKKEAADFKAQKSLR